MNDTCCCVFIAEILCGCAHLCTMWSEIIAEEIHVLSVGISHLVLFDVHIWSSFLISRDYDQSLHHFAAVRLWKSETSLEASVSFDHHFFFFFVLPELVFASGFCCDLLMLLLSLVFRSFAKILRCYFFICLDHLCWEFFLPLFHTWENTTLYEFLRGSSKNVGSLRIENFILSRRMRILITHHSWLY